MSCDTRSVVMVVVKGGSIKSASRAVFLFPTGIPTKKKGEIKKNKKNKNKKGGVSALGLCRRGFGCIAASVFSRKTAKPKKKKTKKKPLPVSQPSHAVNAIQMSAPGSGHDEVWCKESL